MTAPQAPTARVTTVLLGWPTSAAGSRSSTGICTGTGSCRTRKGAPRTGWPSGCPDTGTRALVVAALAWLQPDGRDARSGRDSAPDDRRGREWWS